MLHPVGRAIMPFTKTNRQSGPGASPGVSGNRPESSPEGPSECVSPRRPRSTLIPWLGDVYMLAVAAFRKQNRIVKDHLKIGKSLTTLLPEIALLIFAYSLSVAHDRRPRAPDRGERGGVSSSRAAPPPQPCRGPRCLLLWVALPSGSGSRRGGLAPHLGVLVAFLGLVTVSLSWTWIDRVFFLGGVN